jgi:hypothetical protein
MHKMHNCDRNVSFDIVQPFNEQCQEKSDRRCRMPTVPNTTQARKELAKAVYLVHGRVCFEPGLRKAFGCDVELLISCCEAHVVVQGDCEVIDYGGAIAEYNKCQA